MSKLLMSYKDEKSSRFYIFFSFYLGRHIFSHWSHLTIIGERNIASNTILEAENLEECDDFFHRGAKWKTLHLQNSIPNDSQHIHSVNNQNLSLGKVLETIKDTHPDKLPVIFKNCFFEDDIIIDNDHDLPEICFFDCTFKGDLKITESKISGSLWLINSKIEKHFSLKGTHCTHNIHAEGSNFSGPGGASFRGIRAKSVYLDHGIQGPQDMVWLNEMTIQENLCLGGNFNSQVQIHGIQDATQKHSTTDKDYSMSKIGRILLSKEMNQNETNCESFFSGGISIKNYKTENLEGYNFETRDLEIQENKIFNRIKLENVSILRDLIISDPRSIGAALIDISGCSIQRHFQIQAKTLSSLISLSNSIVDGASFFKFSEVSSSGKVDTLDFFSPHVKFHNEKILQALSARKIFKARDFSAIKMSQNPSLRSDQYCALKKWMADSGKLQLEDEAYFHMRDASSKSWAETFFLGRIFGWGVRLTNIALSAFIIVLSFSFIYLSAGADLVGASLLSIQSFTAAFFGEWETLSKSRAVIIATTLQSVLGIVFVTVFIGAYIRKLLR